jgi:putative ABC transport system substrate-binding protein
VSLIQKTGWAFGLVLTAVATASLPLARGEAVRVPRIGILSPPASPNEQGLREGLRELGYIEGKSIAFESRQFVGTADQARVATAELLRSKIDIIVTSGTPATRGAMQATTTLPIVFAGVGDPVYSGLAASLARPNKNATGVSVLSTELYPKRLEYLHWLAPRARRIAYLMNSANPMGSLQLDVLQKAAPKLGVRVDVFNAPDLRQIDRALQAIRASRPDAIFIGGDATFVKETAKIVQAVRSIRVPAIFPYREYCEQGALMCYGPSMREVGRRTARYVDEILKGATPANLPIEQISTYELIFNLRVAREVGIEPPQDLLLRADEVIR